MSGQSSEVVLSITGRDIWEKLDRIESSVSGIPEKLSTHDKRIEDHETRLRAVERRVWAALGAAAVLGGSAGAVASLLK